MCVLRTHNRASRGKSLQGAPSVRKHEKFRNAKFFVKKGPEGLKSQIANRDLRLLTVVLDQIFRNKTLRKIWSNSSHFFTRFSIIRINFLDLCPIDLKTMFTLINMVMFTNLDVNFYGCRKTNFCPFSQVFETWKNLWKQVSRPHQKRSLLRLW